MPNDINFIDEDEDDDNDLLADLLDEEIAVADGKPSHNADEFNALKTQVESLEREKMGLLKAKQDATRKKQESADRLAQLEGAVGTILSQRQQQGMASLSEGEAAGARSQGIPVTYDDDGNGWIDPQYIAKVTAPYATKIQELENRLQQTDAYSTSQQKAEKVMMGIIGEDERFGPASGKYRAARKWVEDQVLEYANTNGINRVMSSGEALDQIFSDQYTKAEFDKRFNGIDIFDVVTAEDSQTNFRRALTQIANATSPKDDLFTSPREKMDSRFQKVLSKPSALGSQANAKAGTSSVFDKIGSLGTQDIMDLSETQIEALLKLAGQQS